jgi:NADH-quinone oxidoreductase subunit H
MNEILWLLLIFGIKAIIIISFVMLCAAAFVYLERKISAVIQNRIGPNRVGPFGLLQPFADVLKLFLKEDIVPKNANRFYHSLAPIITLGVAFSVFAIIPFASYLKIGDRVIHMGIAPNINIGFLFVLAMTSVGVYGITLAGWSSNNKYSLLGGLRSAAQMISYELAMGLAVISILLMSQDLTLTGIVEAQKGLKWNIFLQPLAFIIFLTSSFAETNRSPFDLPEAEPELVGGYNTEYSGMKFGMFFLAEYANMAAASAIISLLFLGGWNFPFIYEWLGFANGSVELVLVQLLVFLAKMLFMVFFFIWTRWSIPRFRYDQLMNLGWKILLPLGLLNILVTGIILMYI